MTEIIKKIQEILGDFEGSMLKINITPHEIWLDIYETEVPLTIDKKDKHVYVDCEFYNHQLTADMLDELSQICKVLEENIDVVLGLVK
jgi:hypothetical protein